MDWFVHFFYIVMQIPFGERLCISSCWTHTFRSKKRLEEKERFVSSFADCRKSFQISHWILRQTAGLSDFLHFSAIKLPLKDTKLHSVWSNFAAPAPKATISTNGCRRFSGRPEVSTKAAYSSWTFIFRPTTPSNHPRFVSMSYRNALTVDIYYHYEFIRMERRRMIRCRLYVPFIVLVSLGDKITRVLFLALFVGGI